MSKETIVYLGEAKWERAAYLKLVETKVVFDCSGEEYGPIEFNLEDLIKAIELHRTSQNQAQDSSI